MVLRGLYRVAGTEPGQLCARQVLYDPVLSLPLLFKDIFLFMGHTQ